MITLPKALIEGYLSFKENLDTKTQHHYRQLALVGQNPQIMVVACCDSRVSPEIIFNTNPGEMFVIRNISNLIPPYCPDSSYHATSSALEYGVRSLQVKHILVLGHEDCGGIAGSLINTNPQQTGEQPTDFIGKWLDLLEPLSKPLRENNNLNLDEKKIILEQCSLIQSINNLRSFPWISEKEQNGELQLTAAWFSIENGLLWVLNESSGSFYKVTKPIP